MKRSVYDPELRKTESGRRLYGAWKRIRKSDYDPYFESYPAFYKWAMSTGYVVGYRLYRRDNSDWYSPENCYWAELEQADITPAWAEEWCKKWNETVNMIRRHFGLPEF